MSLSLSHKTTNVLQGHFSLNISHKPARILNLPLKKKNKISQLLLKLYASTLVGTWFLPGTLYHLFQVSVYTSKHPKEHLTSNHPEIPQCILLISDNHDLIQEKRGEQEEDIMFAGVFQHGSASTHNQLLL